MKTSLLIVFSLLCGCGAKQDPYEIGGRYLATDFYGNPYEFVVLEENQRYVRIQSADADHLSGWREKHFINLHKSLDSNL